MLFITSFCYQSENDIEEQKTKTIVERDIFNENNKKADKTCKNQSKSNKNIAFPL